jgi:cation transport regulator ChaC
MFSTESTKLDETLKLLNGLHDDSSLSKRKAICNYVRENGMIAVLAYGSLLWNPIEYVDTMICNCILHGYAKGFICEDFVYRGTTNFTGLTMALQEDSDSYVNGALLIPNANQIIPFLRAFVERETPTNIYGTKMDIYRYDFVEIVMPDRSIQYALTCIVNKKSLFYLNPQLTLDEQAQKMAIAYGKNGTNFQYLQRALKTYRDYGLNDSCTAELEDLYAKIISCRQNLPINDQKWLDIYDELQTLEERQQVVTSQNLATFQASIAPYPHRSICLQ